MRTTLKLKLATTKTEFQALLQTMQQFNRSCNFIAKVAFEKRVFHRFKLQKLVYRDVRRLFSLSSQMTIRAIAKVCDAFAKDQTKLPCFRLLGSIAYDDRIISFRGTTTSILTLQGRLSLAMIFGDFQTTQWPHRQGEVDLVLLGESFYLMATLDIAERAEESVEEFIGVDLGIVKLMVDSLGNEASGALIEEIRQKYHRLRRELQQCGSKNAKRHLKKIAKKEAAFRRDVNHKIAKALVKRAQDTSQGIALENLKHIRERTTVRRAERARQSGWAFAQLQQFILYKAKIAGVRAVFVEARNSSRECSQCHHIDKANRKSQALFCCVKCGHAENADFNAAKVIAYRAKEMLKGPLSIGLLQSVSCSSS